MPSDPSYIDYILDQLGRLPGVSARKMFGEYAIYIDTKIVALVCNNQLYIKPTQAGQHYIGTPVEAPAYPGAKPSYLVEDGVDDPVWLQRLFSLTAAELPLPKPKVKPVKKAKASVQKTKN